MLHESRSLVRQALTLVDDTGRTPALTSRLIAFVHALRHQLRGSDPAVDLERLLPLGDCERLKGGRYKPALLPAIELSMGRLSEALAGCERIAGTPIPFTYTIIIHRTIYLYCVLLPFGLVDSIGAMTPVIVAFIGYTFFALEALGAEIEEPFGLAPNDLALDGMCSMIENTLREMQGEVLPPQIPTPKDFIQT